MSKIKLKENGLYRDDERDCLLMYVWSNHYIGLHYFCNEFHGTEAIYDEDIYILSYADSNDIEYFNKSMALNAIGFRRKCDEVNL